MADIDPQDAKSDNLGGSSSVFVEGAVVQVAQAAAPAAAAAPVPALINTVPLGP